MIGFDMQDGDDIDAFLRAAAARAAAGSGESDPDTMLAVLSGLVVQLARQNDALAALQEKTVRVIEALERRVAKLEGRQRPNVRGPFIRRVEAAVTDD